MKVSVSSSLVALYDSARKNYNYSLDFLLSSLDTTVALQNMALLDVFRLHGEKEEIDIDVANIDAIRKVFKTCNSQLIEQLLWVAAIFPEI